MTKTAAMPIYGKKAFKHLLIQNPKADEFDPYLVASGTQALYSLFKR